MEPRKNKQKIMREVTDAGAMLIELFEGFSPVIYPDIAGYPTIGIGHKILKGEVFQIPMTEEEANEILDRDLDIAEKGVGGLIQVSLSDPQFDALVSFTFNLGVFSLKRSTLRSRLNRGEYFGASEEFLKWVWADGRKSNGLIRRRAAERGMFLGGTE